MATKMSLTPVVPATLKSRMNVGSIDPSSIAMGFIVTGKICGGQEVTKPLSKAEFVKQYADRYESKSQAVKAYGQSLRVFTQAAQADFNAKVTRGDRIAMVKTADSGRTNYTLFQPKADTAERATANESLAKENAQLKAALGQMQAQFNELLATLKGLQAPAAK